MITVKVRRSLYGSDFGSVRRGDLVMVSEPTARDWLKRGLAEAVDEITEGPDTKEAPKHKDKMAPPPRHKGDDVPGTSKDKPRPAKIPRRKSE